MAEYIEREAAIEFIRLNYCKDCNSYNGVRCRACSFDDAMLALEDVPVADVVEVVRCKECKYHRIPACPMRLSFNWTNDYDFCSYGERKGGEQE